MNHDSSQFNTDLSEPQRDEDTPRTKSRAVRLSSTPDLAVYGLPIAPNVWPDVLTQTEREVSKELVRGASYRDIARVRDVSMHTIRSQVAKILKRMGVDSTSELIVLLAQYNRCHKT